MKVIAIWDTLAGISVSLGGGGGREGVWGG